MQQKPYMDHFPNYTVNKVRRTILKRYEAKSVIFLCPAAPPHQPGGGGCLVHAKVLALAASPLATSLPAYWQTLPVFSSTDFQFSEDLSRTKCSVRNRVTFYLSISPFETWELGAEQYFVLRVCESRPHRNCKASGPC